MKKIVKERSDVAFYLKMFPLVQIHKDAYDQAKAVICAKKKDGDEAALKVLEEAYAHKPVDKATCETDAVDKSIQLGQSFGLRGTPAMIFSDGSMVKGAVGQDTIEKKLDTMK
jgi:thiol:disulfide interchange protein DsbC